MTNKVLPQLLVAHSVYVVGLYAGKEWVLGLDVGVPWLLIRVLALGGLGFAVWEVKHGRLFTSRAIEVRSLYLSPFLPKLGGFTSSTSGV